MTLAWAQHLSLRYSESNRAQVVAQALLSQPPRLMRSAAQPSAAESLASTGTASMVEWPSWTASSNVVTSSWALAWPTRAGAAKRAVRMAFGSDDDDDILRCMHRLPLG